MGTQHHLRDAPPLVLGADAAHTLRNHLALVISFSDLALAELSAADAARADIEDIRRAARAGLSILDAARRRENDAATPAQ